MTTDSSEPSEPSSSPYGLGATEALRRHSGGGSAGGVGTNRRLAAALLAAAVPQADAEDDEACKEADGFRFLGGIVNLLIGCG